MSSKPTDDQLRQAIDAIFNKYDDDKSGTLEGKEISNLINDAFKSLGRNREVKGDEVGQFVKAIDKNGDGKISKAELFEILKKLINGGWSRTPLHIFKQCNTKEYHPATRKRAEDGCCMGVWEGIEGEGLGEWVWGYGMEGYIKGGSIKIWVPLMVVLR